MEEVYFYGVKTHRGDLGYTLLGDRVLVEVVSFYGVKAHRGDLVQRDEGVAGPVWATRRGGFAAVCGDEVPWDLRATYC